MPELVAAGHEVRTLTRDPAGYDAPEGVEAVAGDLLDESTLSGVFEERDRREAVFGSSIEVVLGVLAFLALVTYLFVVDPREGTTLVADLLGESPPAPATYLLLVAWDVCYRIGTGWWASVASLYRSVRYDFGPERRRIFRRADLETLGFALLQLVLVPFLVDHPILFYAVIGHVVAVAVVTGLSLVALSVRGRESRARNLSP